MRLPATYSPLTVPVQPNFAMDPLPLVTLAMGDATGSAPEAADGWQSGHANETFANHSACVCNGAPCHVEEVLRSPQRHGYALRSCSTLQMDAVKWALHTQCGATLNASGAPDDWRFAGSAFNMDIGAEDVTAMATDDAPFVRCFQRSLQAKPHNVTGVDPLTVTGYVLAGGLLMAAAVTLLPKLLRALENQPWPTWSRLGAFGSAERRPLLPPTALAPPPPPAPTVVVTPASEPSVAASAAAGTRAEAPRTPVVVPAPAPQAPCTVPSRPAQHAGAAPPAQTLSRPQGPCPPHLPTVRRAPDRPGAMHRRDRS